MIWRMSVSLCTECCMHRVWRLGFLVYKMTLNIFQELIQLGFLLQRLLTFQKLFNHNLYTIFWICTLLWINTFFFCQETNEVWIWILLLLNTLSYLKGHCKYMFIYLFDFHLSCLWVSAHLPDSWFIDIF